MTRGHSLAVPSAGMCSVCSLLQAPGDHWPVETVSSYTRVPVSHQGDCSGLLFTRNPMCIVPDCHFRSRSPGDLQCNYKWIFFTVQWNYCIESVQMMVQVLRPPVSPGWPLTAALTYSHCTTAPNGCTALGDTAICWTMHNLGSFGTHRITWSIICWTQLPHLPTWEKERVGVY